EWPVLIRPRLAGFEVTGDTNVGFSRARNSRLTCLRGEVVDSEIVTELAVLVLRIWNQLLTSTIHHPVQIFEGNLADDVWQRIGNFHHVKSSSTALNFQSDRRKHSSRFRTIRHRA